MPKLSRWRKVLVVASVLVTIVLCIGGIFYAKTDIPEAAGHYDENLNRANEQNLFTRIEEVQNVFNVPKNENGAELFRSISDPKAPHPAVMQDDEVDDFERICSLKYLRFSRVMAKPGIHASLELRNLRDRCNALNRRIKNLVKTNDYAEAERDLKLLARLAILAGDEGSLFSSIIRLEISQSVHLTLQDILNSKGNNPTWIAVVENTLKDLDQPIPIYQVLQFELGLEVWVTNYYLDHPGRAEADEKEFSLFFGGSMLPPEIRYGRFLPNFRRAYNSRLLEFYSEAAKTTPARVSQVGDLDALRKLSDDWAARKGISYVLVTTETYAIFSNSVDALLAKRNALQQAIAMIRANWDPALGLLLQPPASRDCDNKPLRLKKVNGTWMIYSVGSNQIDDGGDSKKGDFAIQLPKTQN